MSRSLSTDKRFMMTSPTPNAYLKTQVMTASPAELRMLLIDGAIKFAEQGKVGMEANNFEQAYNGITQCQNIVMELINVLDHEQDPQLCQRLSGLYTFMYTQLMLASTEKDTAKIVEVLDLLRYERETWQMLMDQLAKENIAATNWTETPTAAPEFVDPQLAAPSSLIGGSISIQG